MKCNPLDIGTNKVHQPDPSAELGSSHFDASKDIRLNPFANVPKYIGDHPRAASPNPSVKSSYAHPMSESHTRAKLHQRRRRPRLSFLGAEPVKSHTSTLGTCTQHSKQ